MDKGEEVVVGKRLPGIDDEINLGSAGALQLSASE